MRTKNPHPLQATKPTLPKGQPKDLCGRRSPAQPKAISIINNR